MCAAVGRPSRGQGRRGVWRWPCCLTGVPKRLRRLSTLTGCLEPRQTQVDADPGRACLRTSPASWSSSLTESTLTVTPARAASHRNSGCLGPVATIRSDTHVER
jgi:hypothetical protein